MFIFYWIVGSIMGSLLNGMVLKLLWGWFVVSAIGFPVISLVQAIGIGVVISFLTAKKAEYKSRSTDEYIRILKDRDVMIHNAARSVVFPTLALFVGWVVHLFM